MKKSSRNLLIALLILLLGLAIAYLKLSNEVVNVRYSDTGGTYFYSDGTTEKAPNVYVYKQFDNYFAAYTGKQIIHYEAGTLDDHSRYITIQTTKWNLLFGRNIYKSIPITNTYKEVPMIEHIYYYNGDMTPEKLRTSAPARYQEDMVLLEMFQDTTLQNE
ncbi:MAG: hypothetical protein LKK26_01405 [Solobacterium sp.]|jgi:hypothetical protein|nr:hypothetical protein [Solobacterium sp.]